MKQLLLYEVSHLPLVVGDKLNANVIAFN